ncbi:hypothetical protein XELAEV_18025079mg [Xenopus laevis]|uniref:Secreted protein n=1 Tax=Xenopus laevis TaxID=8355 RepID=A0A974HLH0_XENLA|nr:hypothetical protein XELAEV_18025079mg [Xenopus laevis]
MLSSVCLWDSLPLALAIALPLTNSSESILFTQAPLAVYHIRTSNKRLHSGLIFCNSCTVTLALLGRRRGGSYQKGGGNSSDCSLLVIPSA